MKNIPSIQSVLLLGVLAVAALLLPAAQTQALVVEGLYSEEIAVENQGEPERARAYREALERVFIKVTGERRWLQNASVRNALNNAQNYVEAVSYRSDMVRTMVETGSGELREVTVPQGYISVRFSQDLVDELLAAADIPIWDRNRPSILVWLTVQDADGRRTTLGSSSEHEVLEIIREYSQRRAVPFLIPIQDLTDRRALPVDQAWSLDEQAIRDASARYGADSILAGRLVTTAGGDIVGLWQFIFRDQVDVFDNVDDNLQAYMQAPLERVTGTLARHFGLVSRDLQQQDRVTLRIDGVRDIQTHVALMSYINQLAVVRDVNVASVSRDGLELHVSLTGSREHLAEFISLDRDLQPVNFSLDALDQLANTELLHYRWTRQ